MFVDPNKPLPPATDKKDRVGVVYNSLINIDNATKDAGGDVEESKEEIKKSRSEIEKAIEDSDKEVVAKLQAHEKLEGAIHGETKFSVGLGNKDNWGMATEEEHAIGTRRDAYANPKGLHRLVEEKLRVNPSNYIRGGILPVASSGILGSVPQWTYRWSEADLERSPEDPMNYFTDTPWLFSTENGSTIYPSFSCSRIMITKTRPNNILAPAASLPFGGSTIRTYPNSLDVRRSRPSVIRGYAPANSEAFRMSSHLFDATSVHVRENNRYCIRSMNKNRIPYDIFWGLPVQGSMFKGILEHRENRAYNLISNVVYEDLGWGKDIYIVLDIAAHETQYNYVDAENGPNRPAETIGSVKNTYQSVRYKVPANGIIKINKQANGLRDRLVIKLRDILTYTDAQRDQLVENMDYARSELMAFEWINRIRGDFLVRIPVGYKSLSGNEYVNTYIDLEIKARGDTPDTRVMDYEVRDIKDLSGNKQTLNANLVPTTSGRFLSRSYSVAGVPFHPRVMDGVFNQLGGHVKAYTFYNRQYVCSYKHQCTDVRTWMDLPQNGMPTLKKTDYQAVSNVNQTGMYGDHLRHLPIYIDNEEIHYAVYSRDWRNRYRWCIAVVEKDNVKRPLTEFGAQLSPFIKSIKWINPKDGTLKSWRAYNEPDSDTIVRDNLVFNTQNSFKGHANFEYDMDDPNDPIKYGQEIILDPKIHSWVGANAGAWLKSHKQYFVMKDTLCFVSQTLDANEQQGANKVDCYFGFFKGVTYVQNPDSDGLILTLADDPANLVSFEKINVNNTNSLKLDTKNVVGLDPFEHTDVYITHLNGDANDGGQFRIQLNLAPFNNFYFNFLFTYMEDGTHSFTIDTSARDSMFVFDDQTKSFNVDYDKFIAYGTKTPVRFHVNLQTPVMFNKATWMFCKTPGFTEFISKDMKWVCENSIMSAFPGTLIYPIGSVATIAGDNKIVKDNIFAKASIYNNDALLVRMEGDKHVIYSNRNNPEDYELESHNGAVYAGYMNGDFFTHYDPNGWGNALLPIIDGFKMNFYGYGSSFPAFLGVFGENKPINHFFLEPELPTVLIWDTTKGRTVYVSEGKVTINGNPAAVNNGILTIPGSYTGDVTISIQGLRTVKWSKGLKNAKFLSDAVTKLDFSGSETFTIESKLPKGVIGLASVFEGATGATYPGLENWDVSKITTFKNMFLNAREFKQDLLKWRPSSAINMSGMFRNTKFSSNMANWNVSKCTDFSWMFAGTTLISPEIVNWNISSAIDTTGMFKGAKLTNVVINTWNVSNIVTADEMFADTVLTGTSLANLNNWKFSRLSSGRKMFYRSTFNGSVDNWVFGPGCVIDSMFEECINFNQPLKGWDVRLVVSAKSVLAGCVNYFSGVGGLDWANCVDLSSFFVRCAKFTGFGIETWKTPVVESLSETFAHCSEFNGDVTTWTVGTVIRFNGTFRMALKFNRNISVWNVRNAESMMYMFAGYLDNLRPVAGDFMAFNQDLSSWNVSKLKWAQYMFAATKVDFSMDTWNPNFQDSFRDELPPDLAVKGMFKHNPVFNQPLDHWNMSRVTDISDMFFNAALFNQDLPSWDVSKVTTMQNTFRNAAVFNGDIGGWITTSLTNLQDTFRDATAFAQDINNWDVSNVTTLNGTFCVTTSFDTPLNKWNVSKVKSFYSTFDASIFNQDISMWDTSSAEDMTFMFFKNAHFNRDIGSWNTSKVIKMISMFHKASNFNQDISRWDTSSVVSMISMFRDAILFNSNISNWNVSKVRYMSEMFYNAKAFNQSLSKWNVSNVEAMDFMFYSASAFNSDLNSWNVSKVTTFASMFENAVAFRSSLNNWRTPALTNIAKMFKGDISYAGSVEGWDVSKVTNFESVFEGCRLFNSTLLSWNTSNGTNFWRMFYNNTIFNQDINHWDVSKAETMEAMFYNCEAWNKPITSWNPGALVDKPAIGRYGVRAMFYGCKLFNSALGHWDVSRITDMTEMFVLCTWFNKPLYQWNTSNVTNMSSMFKRAGAYNQRMWDWDVSKVTNMNGMFYGAGSLNTDLNTWNVGKVTNMDEMFYLCVNYRMSLSNWVTSSLVRCVEMFRGCKTFNSDMAGWDMSNVQFMDRMFQDCAMFDGDVSTWNISKVTTLVSIFEGCKVFNQNLNGWDVSNVTTMERMFYGCATFNQDLNNWNVSKVTNMFEMFRDAGSFNGNISNWDTSSVITTSGMFRGAAVFDRDIGLWNVSKITDFTRMFDTARAFNQDINNWDVSNALLMTYMFTAAAKFNQPLDKWDVSKVTNMNSIFKEAFEFNQDISMWKLTSLTQFNYIFHNARAYNSPINDLDVSHIKELIGTFRDAISFNQPLDKWNTSNVEKMQFLFGNANAFDQDISMWNVSKVTTMFNMFEIAVKFNQDLSNWDVSSLVDAGAMFKNAHLFNSNIGGWNTANVTSMQEMFAYASSFNQDLSGWNVTKVGRDHVGFDTEANAWVLPRPNFVA